MMATNEDLLASLVNTAPGQGHVERLASEPPAKVQPVRGYERAKPTQRKPSVMRPLFERSSTDRARPFVIGAIAFAFLVLSWVSTTTQVGIILAAGGVKLSPTGMLIAGLGVSAMITICEIVFSELVWYWPFLAMDVALTLWWIWPPVFAWSSAAGAGVYGAVVLGGIIGVVGAYLPERVLLGHRRK